MNYVHELNRAMHDNARFDAVVARLAANQNVKIAALREIVGLFVGFVPGRGHRRRDLIQTITEHRTLDARQRARAANLDAHKQGVVTARGLAEDSGSPPRNSHGWPYGMALAALKVMLAASSTVFCRAASDRMTFAIGNMLAGDLPVLGGNLLAQAGHHGGNEQLHPPRLGSPIARRPGPGQAPGVKDSQAWAVLFLPS
jgi:hypothetical protein